MNTYLLMPKDHQKSFNGKAFITVFDDGSEILYSYATPVIKKTPGGKYIRLWNNWSATTGRHINAYCGLNKAEYIKLPTTEERTTPDGLKERFSLVYNTTTGDE